MSGQLSNLIIRARVEKLNALIQEHGSGAEENTQLDQRNRRVQHRLVAAEAKELIDAYVHGDSVHQLATRFHVHRTTVLNHLERANVARRPDVAKLTSTDIVEATDLYAGGRSLAYLGFRLAVDAETVRKALRRAGVPLRPRRGRDAKPHVPSAQRLDMGESEQNAKKAHPCTPPDQLAST